ncbi:MAG: glycosyltransferase family 4 protein [Planctomycetota bacterium]|nr:glycosyltransferase family 4 protein [Planctomycetota bacterium]
MRVVHVNTERGWRGGEQQILYLARGLREADVAQTFVCQPNGELRARLASEGFEVLPRRMGGYADLRSSWFVARHARERGADILHLHTANAHAIGTRAARWAGTPRPRTVIARRVAYSIFRHSFFGLNRIKYTRTVDRILCITEAVRRQLLEDGLPAERLAVVPSGVDPARFEDVEDKADAFRAELGIPETAWVVGAVGALTPEKGHTNLLHAAALLRGDIPGLAVVLVGKGPLRQALEDEADVLGIADVVHFAGFRDDVPSWLRWFDVLAFPSLMEGMGTTVLDALCLAKPVVASRVGGIPEIIRDEQEGLLVEPDDHERLAAALLRLHKDPALGERLGAAGRQSVLARYTWNHTVRATLDAYRAVLDNAG